MVKKMLTSGTQDMIQNHQRHCSITLSRPLYLLNSRQSRPSMLQRDRLCLTKMLPTLFRVLPPLQVAVILLLSHLRLTLQCRWHCQAQNEGGHIFQMSWVLIWIKIRVILVGTRPVHVCLHGIILGQAEAETSLTAWARPDPQPSRGPLQAGPKPWL